MKCIREQWRPGRMTGLPTLHGTCRGALHRYRLGTPSQWAGRRRGLGRRPNGRALVDEIPVALGGAIAEGTRYPASCEVPIGLRNLVDALFEMTNRSRVRSPSRRIWIITYMLAPLVVDGAVVGTLNFARNEDRAFGTRELASASALSLHVSTRLTARRLNPARPDPWAEILTARGLEVAELAARGLTTFEVGRILGVSSNTVKKHLQLVYLRLGVGSRAELAMMLSAGGDAATRQRRSAT